MKESALGFYASSTTDVWAGGSKLFRWDRKQTKEVAYRPLAPSAEIHIEAIGGHGANDVWVASENSDAGKMHLSHWNGKTWSQYPVPGPLLDSPRDLAVASETEAWLLTRTRLSRWNGMTWADVPTPEGLRGYVLTLTADDVWISGDATIYRRSRR